MSLSAINGILGEVVDFLAEETKRLKGDRWELNGQKGFWRTINGNKIFFPDVGEPVGMPDEMEKAATGKVKGEGDDAQDVQKSVSADMDKIEGTVSGAGEKAVEEMGDGSEEEQDALDSFDRGERLNQKQKKTLASGGINAVLALGLGAALMGALPGLLAYATMYLVATTAVDKIVDKIGRIFEDKTSRRKELGLAIEGGVRDALRDIADGKIDLELMSKARLYAEHKAKKKRK